MRPDLRQILLLARELGQKIIEESGTPKETQPADGESPRMIVIDVSAAEVINRLFPVEDPRRIYLEVPRPRVIVIEDLMRPSKLPDPGFLEILEPRVTRGEKRENNFAERRRRQEAKRLARRRP